MEQNNEGRKPKRPIYEIHHNDDTYQAKKHLMPEWLDELHQELEQKCRVIDHEKELIFCLMMAHIKKGNEGDDNMIVKATCGYTPANMIKAFVRFLDGNPKMKHMIGAAFEVLEMANQTGLPADIALDIVLMLKRDFDENHGGPKDEN